MMHTPFRRNRWLAVVLALLVSPVLRISAQEPAAEHQPAVVVSVAGIDRLLADIGYLTRAAGMPQVGGLISVMSGPYLDGLNAKKPAGLLVTFRSAEPASVVFVPVTDMSAVLNKIEEQIGKPQEAGGGLMKIQVQREIFFREQGGWLFVSDQAANLTDLPDDPSRFLGDLSQQYAAALQVNGRSIPQPLRNQMLDKARTDFERGLEKNLADQPESKREMSERLQRQGFENLVSAFADVDQLTVGWGTDSQAGKTFLELQLSAQPESKLANQLNRASQLQTDFSGFLLPDAAVTLSFSASLTQPVIDQTCELLAASREQMMRQIEQDPKMTDPGSRLAIKDAFGTLLDVFSQTVSQGNLDGGGAMVLAPDAIRVVAGGLVADGAAVESAIRKIVDVAGGQPGFPQVSFDAETYKSVDLHTAKFPIPAHEQKSRKVLGDQLDVVLGTGPTSVYLAFGKECADLLKRVIDGSQAAPDQPSSPVRLHMALTPVLEFADALNDEEPAVTAMAKALRDASGKDGISLAARGVDNGVVYRFEVEEDVLGLIGVVARFQGTRSEGR